MHGDRKRFESGYFTLTNAQNALISHDKYITGDACRRDADGYYWITGRIDDVINVSGHRVETAEVRLPLLPAPRLLSTSALLPFSPHLLPISREASHFGTGEVCDLADGGRWRARW